MLSSLNIKRYIGFAVFAAGIAVIALGAVFVMRGAEAKSEIRAALADEQVTTTIDGVELAVLDQRTLRYQADVIKSHTLERYGPWQDIPRIDETGAENPVRRTFLDGMTLRNSLYIAEMGLNVAEMVIVLGVVFLVTGIAVSTSGVVLVGMARYVTRDEGKVAPVTAPSGAAE